MPIHILKIEIHKYLQDTRQLRIWKGNECQETKKSLICPIYIFFNAIKLYISFNKDLIFCFATDGFEVTEMFCKNLFRKKKKTNGAVLFIWSYALKGPSEEVQFSKVASLQSLNLMTNKLFIHKF